MKIITILILCLTASLSLAHSTLSYKERGDAFAYDYSEICTDNVNCDLTLINRIPQNINLWLDTIGYPKIFSSAPPETFLPHFPYRATTANYFGFASETDQNIHFYYHPLAKFSSPSDANAYFNIHILNNMPNNQLGYLRWITYDFQISNDQHRTSTEVYQKSYFLSFGTFIIQKFKDIETNLIYIFTKEDLNKVELSYKSQLWPKKYNLIPQKFEKMPYPYYINKNDLYLFNMRETYFPSEVLITIKNKDKNIYSLSNKTKYIQNSYFCLSTPKEYSISNNWLAENHCREFKLAPSISIEINIDEI